MGEHVGTKVWGCVVIGGGHAGIEAALAASRMGVRTAMVTLSRQTIGQMSCNPAIGGVGKGQLVKEIDALGGEMGLTADRTAIQFRQLNASKGQAVRSSRCQSDRKRYRALMRRVVEGTPGLTVIEGEVATLQVKNGKIQGLELVSGDVLKAQTVVIGTGTFLRGRIHRGLEIVAGGRLGEANSVPLAQSLQDLGFEIRMFKTGTPPRLDGRTIDFSSLEVQHSDNPPQPFSFRTPLIPPDQKLIPCYITRTRPETLEVIRENLHLSPMYSGQIQATGVRYCPSIEDKVKKFPDRQTHHVFLEPEGLDTYEYYPNGISTGLPEDVQERFVRTIPGLEKVVITQPGYSIEHGVIPATELTPFLETRRVKGLFLAGQINGTTGYEEAAAQGLMAGINAALQVKGNPPLVLGRHEAYIGVLLDDLVTKGTDEPYRMFTSRVEHRLVVREDNADRRLAGYGYRWGLLSERDYAAVQKKYERIEKEIQHLKAVRIYPSSPAGRKLNERLEALGSASLRQPASLADILRRPEVRYAAIAEFDGRLQEMGDRVVDQVEYEVKYAGFIQRQQKEIERFQHIEKIQIPEGFDFRQVPGLSIEIRQKLEAVQPMTLGQAHRISGVTPAAISVLMIYLKKWRQTHSAPSAARRVKDDIRT